MPNIRLTNANLTESHRRSHGLGWDHTLTVDERFSHHWHTSMAHSSHHETNRAARHLIAELKSQIELIESLIKE